MSQETWSAVDQYVIDTFGLEDSVLIEVQAACERAGLPPIQVSATQGKYLELLAKMIGAQRVLEIGTLGGYSTIWMARGLPASGRIVTMELDRASRRTEARRCRGCGVSTHDADASFCKHCGTAL